WNPWSDGVCSRTCGGGVMKSTRTCKDNSNEGCHGNRVKYTSCNTQECADYRSFRAVQCADYNHKPINGRYYEWVPYLGDAADRCKLVCSATNGTLQYTMSDRVVDGTPCDEYATEVCVEGTCKSVGCDRVLGSNKVEDACRICGGEGKHCKTIKNSVQTSKLKKGYNDFLVIPKGATNILVRSQKDSVNHFALRTIRGKFLLNGKWSLTPYSSFHRYGTTFYYSSEGERPQLSAVGPTTTNLILVLVVKEKIADIDYEYSIQKEGETTSVALRYLQPQPPPQSPPSTSNHQPSSSSSKRGNNDTAKKDAATGRVYISSEMVEPGVRVLHAGSKSKTVGSIFPRDERHNYRRLSALTSLGGVGGGVGGPGGASNPDQGAGFGGSRGAASGDENNNNNVYDDDDDDDDGDDDDDDSVGVLGVSVDNDEDEAGIDDLRKLARSRVTFVPVDPNMAITGDAQGLTQYQWQYGEWTECSVSCGSGVQRRVVMCYDVFQRKNIPERCDQTNRPSSQKACQVSCNIQIRWVQSGWTECSETCDGGVMSSLVKCMERSGDSERQVGDNLCAEREGPAKRLTKICNDTPCPYTHSTYEPDQTCASARYGCCEDGVTAARGPNYGGCPGCKHTQFGCCPDGATPAEGHNYAGCPSRRTTTTVGHDHCSLATERGTCSNYVQKWGYDTETRRCKQFWYGGCGGNGNRFDDERACLDACRSYTGRPETREPVTRRPTVVTREPVTSGGSGEHCSLATERGTCSNYVQKWGYDTETRRCKQFWYGGCGGNGNRFDDERACLDACRSYTGRPETREPVTRRPTVVTREPVTSGGSGEHCSLATERGTCSNYVQKWGYDTETKRCKQFWYGGCGGNGNRFDDERACLEACRSYTGRPETREPVTRRPTVVTREPVTSGGSGEHCSLATERGTCSNYVQKWGYDTETKRCKQFWYGGCGGNGNRFDDERACLEACRSYTGRPETREPVTRRPTVVTREPVTSGGSGEHCFLATERGTCSNYVQKWGYDTETKRCKQFWYGGCGGNGNRFESEIECRTACSQRRVVTTPTRPQGCSGTAYGCCEDQRTPARGPNQEGCPERRTCESSRYGCCPDGVTAARGENYAGCRQVVVGGCAGTRFGCCPDGVTAARGENYGGCRQVVVGGCAGTRYGCCPDGVTGAAGPNYHGCRTTTVATSGDCTSPKDPGTCSDHKIKWFYDSATGSCQQFWYGGCGGNGNRYDTKDDCHHKCSHRTPSKAVISTQPSPVDVCRMPKETGPCRSNQPRWYFHYQTASCQKFEYGGCQGNENNFESEKECMERCFVPNPIIQFTVPPNEKEISRDPKVVCHMEVAAGSCDDNYVMWYYDSKEGQCNKFNYTGCYGNSNRYNTKESCESLCNRETVCNFPEAYGQCSSQIIRYRYDTNTADCIPFRYSGCNGNANNFASVGACRRKCGVIPDTPTTTAATENPAVICRLPQDSGICYAYSKQWFFNFDAGQCEEFAYGGCGGNANRFVDLQTCQKSCKAFITNPKPPMPTKKATDRCTPPMIMERCNVAGPSWFYNNTMGTCQRTPEGFCLKYNNSFDSQESCNRVCDSKIICQMPSEPGICLAYMPLFYYNQESGACERFVYGGCGGNANRFPTIDSCKAVCKPGEKPQPPVPADICYLPKKSGKCYAYSEQYYFNKEAGRCEMFVYGGCGGNANRFATYAECRLKCGDHFASKPRTFPYTQPISTLPPPRTLSAQYCHLQPELGSCSDVVYHWYYNMADRKCHKFQYSGCGGNNNRYLTQRECENICQPADVCSLPKEQGICYSYSPQYYFNMTSRKCDKFVYGGCGGNANRFATVYKCEQLCSAFVAKPMTTAATTVSTQSMKDLCKLPKEAGLCYSYAEMYYYNYQLGQCERFVYGGCGGNDNRFATQLQCQQVCQPGGPTATPTTSATTPNTGLTTMATTTRKSVECDLPKLVGPCSYNVTAWYYNPTMGVCSRFTYSGCGGNQNNFRSKGECEAACRPDKESPSQVCHASKDRGSCGGAIQAWYYDMADGQCKQFLYGGCDGNKNRFNSRLQCEDTCSPRDICRLPEESGLCYGYTTAYYYDNVQKKCRKFVYGGCGGNANRFATMQLCNRICASQMNDTTTMTTPAPTTPTTPYRTGPIVPRQPEKCKLPAARGGCQDLIKMWYYDPSGERCYQFYYTGCGGNDNRFGTELECLASCRLGPVSIPSNTALPTITLPPSATPTSPTTTNNNIVNLAADPNRKMVLECGEAVGYSVTWTHNGKDIVASPRYEIQGWKLVIRNMSYADIGLYTCRRNDDMKDTPLEKYQVNIKVPVTIEMDRKKYMVPLNRSVSIPCVAYGVPKPILQWTKDGRRVPPAASSAGASGSLRPYTRTRATSAVVLGNGTLVVHQLTPRTAGLYTCTATNGRRQTATRTVRVSIQNSLHVVVDRNQKRFHEGDMIKLKCHTNGYPYTDLQWYHNMAPVRSTGRVTAREGLLMIDRATFDDSGIYTCKGRNRQEEIGKDERIHVLPKPNEVTEVCRDKLPVLRCRIIVTSQLCDQKAFRTSCCVSCRKHRSASVVS
ncbi:papilin-like, partial, partial [Argonauta hians]